MHPRSRDNGWLTDPCRVRPSLRRDRCDQAAQRRSGDRGQDEPRRVRHGVLHRELGVWDHLQPLGPDPGARWIVGRLRGLRGSRLVAPRLRLRHGRLDTPTSLFVRCGWDEADLRNGEPVRVDRIRLVAGSNRPLRPDGGRLGSRPFLHLGLRPAGLHVVQGAITRIQWPGSIEGWTGYASAS